MNVHQAMDAASEKFRPHGAAEGNTPKLRKMPDSDNAKRNSPVKSWADEVQEVGCYHWEQTGGAFSFEMKLWIHACGNWLEPFRAIETFRSFELRFVDRGTGEVGIGDIRSAKIRTGKVCAN